MGNKLTKSLSCVRKGDVNDELGDGDLTDLHSDDRKDDVNTQDKDGWTKLHWAADGGESEECRRLIAAGANVNIKGKDDNTAIMKAAEIGLTEVVRILADNAQWTIAGRFRNFAGLHLRHTVFLRTLPACYGMEEYLIAF